jgi:HD-like signal output (HDOD) protein
MPISNLREKVQNIINLPSLPVVAMEIINIIDDPDTNVHTLSKIISKDQVIASKILKVANSPFYSYPRIISTIDFALTVLGFETVKEIVVSLSFISHFKKYQAKNFDVNKFWTHSILSSIICRELSKEIGYKIKGEAFICGLIHDIGIFTLNQFFQKEFEKLLEMMDTGKYNLLLCEKEVFGATHAEVGGWLFERWNFPQQLVDGVRNHHRPSIVSKNPQLNSLIYYTEYITKEKNIATFPLESSITYSQEYLPIITYEELKDIDKFYEKNSDLLLNEIEKVQYFV